MGESRLDGPFDPSRPKQFASPKQNAFIRPSNHWIFIISTITIPRNAHLFAWNWIFVAYIVTIWWNKSSVSRLQLSYLTFLINSTYSNSPTLDQLQAIKLIEAKKFLLENPTENKAVMTRIFDINVKTLTAFIRRDEKKRKERDEHNKILKSHHEDAILVYIRSLLNHDLQSTHDLIYSFIVSLKKSYNCPPPSTEWFRCWWQRSKLHKIKSKPLPVIRYQASHESDGRQWFVSYVNVLKSLNIRSRRNWISNWLSQRRRNIDVIEFKRDVCSQSW